MIYDISVENIVAKGQIAHHVLKNCLLRKRLLKKHREVKQMSVQSPSAKRKRDRYMGHFTLSFIILQLGISEVKCVTSLYFLDYQ